MRPCRFFPAGAISCWRIASEMRQNGNAPLAFPFMFRSQNTGASSHAYLVSTVSTY